MTQWVSSRALGEAVSAREEPPLCALASGEAQADTAPGLSSRANPCPTPSLADKAPFSRAIRIWGPSGDKVVAKRKQVWLSHPVAPMSSKCLSGTQHF